MWYFRLISLFHHKRTIPVLIRLIFGITDPRKIDTWKENKWDFFNQDINFFLIFFIFQSVVQTSQLLTATLAKKQFAQNPTIHKKYRVFESYHRQKKIIFSDRFHLGLSVDNFLELYYLNKFIFFHCQNPSFPTMLASSGKIHSNQIYTSQENNF